MTIKTKIIGIALVLALPVIAMTAANAQTFRAQSQSTISQGEQIDGSAFVVGTSVDVAGNVKGDLYCAGQNVTISGTVQGDVLCAAQTIRVSGQVDGNIRLAGQTISVDGAISKNASIAGQNITIDGKGKVFEDAVVAGQSIVINGVVNRDVVAAGESATIGSTVGRNVTANISNLTFANGANVGGVVNYTSAKQATVEDGAHITGAVTQTEPAKDTSMAQNNTFNGIGILVIPLMLIVSALVLVLLFPRVFRSVTDPSVASVPQALIAVLIGFIASIAMPLVIVIAFVTVLGIPLAFVILVTWILIMLLAGAFAAFYTGRMIWKSGNAILAMLIGVVVLSILMLIPYLNILVGVLVSWFGSGAILLSIKRRWVMPRYSMDDPVARPLRTRKRRARA
ncbi:MAG TPA: polymer-forming cytoskeletal protein [Candidatus Saccharimonadales bacterium]|nr:polymer-forming cytoskeletal protein [Candidatus Saccharimonadales bacterium]